MAAPVQHVAEEPEEEEERPVRVLRGGAVRRPERVRPVEEEKVEEEVPPEILEKSWATAVKEYNKSWDEVMEQKGTVFDFLYHRMEASLREAVTTHAEYTDAEANEDVLILWEIIVDMLIGGAYLDTAERRRQAVKKWERFRMKDGQHLGEFKDDFELWVKKLEELRVPTDEIGLSQEFMRKQ